VRWASLAAARGAAPGRLPPEVREEELASCAPSATSRVARVRGRRARPLDRQRFRAAGRTATAAVQPGEARRLTNLGTSRASQGRADGGEQAFRQALNADPTSRPPTTTSTSCCATRESSTEADAEFWLAVELGVADREMSVVAPRARLTSSAATRPGRADAREGRRRLPDAALVWLQLRRLPRRAGGASRGARLLERAVVLAPANPIRPQEPRRRPARPRDRDGARRALAESLRLDPANPSGGSSLPRSATDGPGAGATNTDMPELRWQEGDENRTVRVDNAPAGIGRASDNQVVLKDFSVSRHTRGWRRATARGGSSTSARPTASRSTPLRHRGPACRGRRAPGRQLHVTFRLAEASSSGSMSSSTFLRP